MVKPAIAPVTWLPPNAPKLTGTFARNTALADLQLLHIPGTGPQDVAILHEGDVVTGLADGRICRVSTDGRRTEVVADTGVARSGSRSATTVSSTSAMRSAGCCSWTPPPGRWRS